MYITFTSNTFKIHNCLTNAFYTAYNLKTKVDSFMQTCFSYNIDDPLLKLVGAN
jgi:hypothetical protein